MQMTPYLHVRYDIFNYCKISYKSSKIIDIYTYWHLIKKFDLYIWKFYLVEQSQRVFLQTLQSHYIRLTI